MSCDHLGLKGLEGESYGQVKERRLDYTQGHKDHDGNEGTSGCG